MIVFPWTSSTNHKNYKLSLIVLGILIFTTGCSNSEASETALPSMAVVADPSIQGSPEPTLIASKQDDSTKLYTLGDTMVREKDEMVMVYVPPGTFQIGSSQADIEAAIAMCNLYPNQWKDCKPDWFEIESPQYFATLDGFWIDRTEVTNAQYERCVELKFCNPSRLANNPSYNGEDYPVAGIPWQDAVDYCSWVGGKLPAETEWEVAARGPQSSIFAWGDEFDCERANLYDPDTRCDDGFSEPSPVGSFLDGVSWCGAYDLSGNVWEWVANPFWEYPSNNETIEPDPAAQYVLRGGSWGYPPAFSRGAYRYLVPPDADYLAVGFRCVESHIE
jgi:formylglycine-generating enzyme required for sulfatase activity